MARRNFIHRKHLSLLRIYFRKKGWTLLEPKGFWEVFRATHPDYNRPVIVYKSSNPEHFTIDDRDSKIFQAFIQWTKDSSKGFRTFNTGIPQ